MSTIKLRIVTVRPRTSGIKGCLRVGRCPALDSGFEQARPRGVNADGVAPVCLKDVEKNLESANWDLMVGCCLLVAPSKIVGWWKRAMRSEFRSIVPAWEEIATTVSSAARNRCFLEQCYFGVSQCRSFWPRFCSVCYINLKVHVIPPVDDEVPVLTPSEPAQ